MTTQRENILQAGNTCTTLKPVEAIAGTVLKEGGAVRPKIAPQPSLNSPDIDECAPLINAGPDLGWHDSSDVDKFAAQIPEWQETNKPNNSYLIENAPQITEEIPPTNLWSLRWRINQLEERVGQLEDRICKFSANSAWKI